MCEGVGAEPDMHEEQEQPTLQAMCAYVKLCICQGGR